LLGMHAAASLAFAIGALGGSLIATQGAPGWCALVVLVVIAPVALAQHRLGPRAPTAAAGPLGAGPTVQQLASVPNPATQPSPATHGILRMGVILGLTIAAEITAQMWSARFLEQQAAALAAYAGAGAAIFAGFQALIRLVGDSLGVATLGFITVASASSFGQSLLGFAMVGLGTACVVPCCFALTAQQAGHDGAGSALGLVSLVAGALRLPTPLVLSAVAAQWSDATAFAGVAGGLLIALLMAWRAQG
jgi:hypothetical protein